jgi:hypothetical protein
MANLGKFRGLSATANTTFASGVFTLSRHYQQVRQSLWPFPIFGPIDYLIVGGGGAGGPLQNAGGSFLAISGGGGGGQVREFLAQYLLRKGAFSVVVGTGGTVAYQSNSSTPGGDSSFNDITSTGGGVGSITPSSAEGGLGSYNPVTGTRGGGSFYFTSNSGFAKQFVRRAPNGGSAAYGSTATGATLGAGGGAGGGGSTTGNYIGGDGTTSVITGLGYGGGGNTVQLTNMPATGYTGTQMGGTKQGFGAGYYTSDGGSYTAPEANRGGGGGGKRGAGSGGHSGAAGVVVIRYVTGSLSATGGTTSTSGIYTLHTFTTSGTFTVL